MNISDNGLSLILEFEGLHKKIGDGRYMAYRCPAGAWTIYAGCTEGVREGMICTEEEGRALFRKELAKHEAAVVRLVTVDLNQNHRDSLISFSYNVGSGALANSTLLRKLNKGDYRGAQGEFLKWDKATVDGKLTVLRGLSRRRAAESELFARRTDEEDATKAPQMMPQAVEAPVEPVSRTKIATLAATAGAAIPTVPPVVTDNLTNATAWRSAGDTFISLATVAWSKPTLLVLVAAGMIGAVWLPKIWRSA